MEHWKTVSVVHSLQSLFMEQRVVCLLGGWAAGADCLFANIAVARIAFFFADSARYLYTPSVSVVFVHLSLVTLVAPSLLSSLLFSSILEWTTNDATDPSSSFSSSSRTMLHLQKMETSFGLGIKVVNGPDDPSDPTHPTLQIHDLVINNGPIQC